jgi:hypothetical protein
MISDSGISEHWLRAAPASTTDHPTAVLETALGLDAVTLPSSRR